MTHALYNSSLGYDCCSGRQESYSCFSIITIHILCVKDKIWLFFRLQKQKQQTLLNLSCALHKNNGLHVCTVNPIHHSSVRLTAALCKGSLVQRDTGEQCQLQDVTREYSEYSNIPSSNNCRNNVILKSDKF